MLITNMFHSRFVKQHLEFKKRLLDKLPLTWVDVWLLIFGFLALATRIGVFGLSGWYGTLLAVASIIVGLTQTRILKDSTTALSLSGRCMVIVTDVLMVTVLIIVGVSI